MTSEHDPSALIGETLGKKFLVRRVIGSGGMGVVYEVEHLFTKRTGALKLLHRSFASVPTVVERFVREASAAGRIGSPHIVETMDAGELPSGEPYMFMELLRGSSLRDVIRARGRLPFEEARGILMQAAEGLAAAHAAGIVHRDIKPDNLFLCGDAPPFVKILDFGISKFSEHHTGDHRLTAQGAPMGTPYYMSPEQVVGKRDVDPRTDVYSLGVVLYESLAGKVPFDADTLPALSVKIFEGRYTPLSALLDAPPSGLDPVLARAMAAEPGRRYASVLELRDALAALGGVTAPGTSTEDVFRPSESALAEALAPSAITNPEARGKARSLAWLGALLVLGSGVALAWAFGVRPHASGSATSAAASSTERSRASAYEAPASAQAEPPSPPLPRAPDAGAPSSSVVVPPSPPKAASRGVAVRGIESPAAPPSSSPSRAARDGLSEKNPFAD